MSKPSGHFTCQQQGDRDRLLGKPLSSDTLDGVARIVTLVKWTVVAALVTLGLVYAVEDLRIRHAASASPGSQTETLTFYYSTRLKNGRVQVYYDQPQTEVCVRALFPHVGRRPCWYARREPVRLVS